jgi:hypothetical protein
LEHLIGESGDHMWRLFVIVPFAAASAVALTQFFLSRSILGILRQVAPEKERELTVHTGIHILDRTLWVRPEKFAAFARTKESFGDERLAHRLRQYDWTHRVGLGIVFYFVVLMVLLFWLFVRHSK